MSVPPFHDHLGIEHLRIERGEAELSLPLTPALTNKRGVVHGGVTAALLDAALGAAVVSDIPKEWWCATISLSVNFVSGGRGARLIAFGRVVRRGTSVAFAEGRVEDERGELVATAQGSWRLWTRKPGS